MATWENCTRCDYSKYRKRVVLGKGDLPCDILFCAEGPGDSEDALGLPMMGQAGRHMDNILVQSGIVKYGKSSGLWGPHDNPTWMWKVYFINLVGCYPISLVDGKKEKDAVPRKECVLACKPRVEEMLEFADPKLLVTIGKPADDWWTKWGAMKLHGPSLRSGTSKHGPSLRSGTSKHGIKIPCPVVSILHPAGIARKTFVQRDELFRQQIVRLRIAIRDHLTARV
jgi:uracil-DNA glycosylase